MLVVSPTPRKCRHVREQRRVGLRRHALGTASMHPHLILHITASIVHVAAVTCRPGILGGPARACQSGRKVGKRHTIGVSKAYDIKFVLTICDDKMLPLLNFFSRTLSLSLAELLLLASMKPGSPFRPLPPYRIPLAAAADSLRAVPPAMSCAPWAMAEACICDDDDDCALRCCCWYPLSGKKMPEPMEPDDVTLLIPASHRPGELPRRSPARGEGKCCTTSSKSNRMLSVMLDPSPPNNVSREELRLNIGRPSEFRPKGDSRGKCPRLDMVNGPLESDNGPLPTPLPRVLRRPC